MFVINGYIPKKQDLWFLRVLRAEPSAVPAQRRIPKEQHIPGLDQRPPELVCTQCRLGPAYSAVQKPLLELIPLEYLQWKRRWHHIRRSPAYVQIVWTFSLFQALHRNCYQTGSPPTVDPAAALTSAYCMPYTSTLQFAQGLSQGKLTSFFPFIVALIFQFPPSPCPPKATKG